MRRAIRDLLEFLPDTAELRHGDTVGTVQVSVLVPGDVVVIRPGSRIPVDGEVVQGHSFVDQSTITGESVPVEMTTGSPVFAGTMNQTGGLEVRTVTLGLSDGTRKTLEIGAATADKKYDVRVSDRPLVAVIPGAVVDELAKGMNELRAKLVGILQTPATRVAQVLQAPAGQLARVMGAYARKVES